jgi:hypothetical protein
MPREPALNLGIPAWLEFIAGGVLGQGAPKFHRGSADRPWCLNNAFFPRFSARRRESVLARSNEERRIGPTPLCYVYVKSGHCLWFHRRRSLDRRVFCETCHTLARVVAAPDYQRHYLAEAPGDFSAARFILPQGELNLYANFSQMPIVFSTPSRHCQPDPNRA